MLNRLRLNFRSIRLISETITEIISVSRSCHTRSVSKTTLFSKISPLGQPGSSVLPELDKWVENGKKIGAAELQRIVRALRKRRRFTHALEISEWMGNKGICKFSSREHAVQLDLISRVHGLQAAESYFNNLDDQDKTEKTYGALLNCYVRECLVDKSLSHFQKMKEIGFPPSCLTYNDLMSLYVKMSQYEKVLDVLIEMKENGVSPDNFSYRICITSYGMRSDLNGMEKLLEEMESQSHITMDWNTYSMVASFYIKAGIIDKAISALKKSEEKLDKDGLGYNHLISLYASVGNKNEVIRLWCLEKAACKRYINRDYITMLGSLMKLDAFEEAEKLLEEWESSGNCYDFRVPNTVLVGYCQKGLSEKAETLLKSIETRGKTPIPNSWVIVAVGYEGKGEIEKTMECMKKALSLSLQVGNENWRPNPKVIKCILNWLGDEGDVKSAEAFVSLLRMVIPMNREMHHALIKANIRGGKEVDELVQTMKDDGIDEDLETKKILSLRQEQPK
ncbi:PREDICTED: pentatricopeptide repeat-containing protein At4g21705, mitochondrial [Nelumbo nucifera]|uniref:Pentatricopeptide repeat-containing protein At4g21705, mitochondrial n=2 Tax=Nelumbo nucifera TaxID=4432 RepID=A0A1U7Z580_NELNU|nr:PREDICTED: pentatricopeptide repeat-containing protein At4g21705, mitochondrial [Nelumbo nucifera]DAD20926.1 TPA_asm: hypothetical protein HUJ06_022389 [Nelumbo nucifera]